MRVSLSGIYGRIIKSIKISFTYSVIHGQKYLFYVGMYVKVERNKNDKLNCSVSVPLASTPRASSTYHDHTL